MRGDSAHADPKRKPPSWCPKRKTPCELRVYSFISEEARQRRLFFGSIYGSGHEPPQNDYGMCFQGTTEWSPQQFWEICNQYGADLKLPVTVGFYEIVEIDDGFKPVCFYRTYLDALNCLRDCDSGSKEGIITFENGQMFLKGKNGRYATTIHVNTQCEVSYAVRLGYMLDAMRQFDSKHVTISVVSSISPIIVTDGSGATAFVLPVRIETAEKTAA